MLFVEFFNDLLPYKFYLTLKMNMIGIASYERLSNIYEFYIMGRTSIQLFVQDSLATPEYRGSFLQVFLKLGRFHDRYPS